MSRTLELSGILLSRTRVLLVVRELLKMIDGAFPMNCGRPWSLYCLRAKGAIFASRPFSR
jgi:hypothetical protein